MAASAASLATSRALLSAESMSFSSDVSLPHASRDRLAIETDSEVFQIETDQDETPSIVRVSSMDSDLPSPRTLSLPSPSGSTGSSLLSPISSLSAAPPFSLPSDRRLENLKLRRRSGVSPSHVRGHSSEFSTAQPSPPVSPHCPSPTGAVGPNSFATNPNSTRSALARAPWARTSLGALPSFATGTSNVPPSSGPVSSSIPIPAPSSNPVSVRSTLGVNLSGIASFSSEQNLSARNASQRLSSSPILRPFSIPSSLPPSSHSSTSTSLQPSGSVFSSLGPSAAAATSSPTTGTREAKLQHSLSAVKPRALWNSNTPVKVNHSIAVPTPSESPHETRRFPNGLYIQASHSAHNLRQFGPGSAGGLSEKGMSPKRPSTSQNSSPVTKRLCASPAPTNFVLDADYPSSSGGAPVPVGGPSRSSSSSDDLDSDLSSPPQSGELSASLTMTQTTMSSLPASAASALSSFTPAAEVASPASTSTPQLVRPDAIGFDDDSKPRRKPRTCASAGNTPRMVAKRCPPTPSGKAPSPLLQRDATLFQYGGIPPLPAPPVASTPLRARSNSHSNPVASPHTASFPVPRPVDRDSGFAVPSSAPRSLLFGSLSEQVPLSQAPPSTVSSTRSIMSLSTQATPMSCGADGDVSPPAPTGLAGDDCSILSGTGDTEAAAESPQGPAFPNVPVFATSNGNQLANYEKILLLGQGAYGEVWRAREISSNRVVALKKHIKRSDSLARVAMLQRQHTRVSALLPHDNILKYELCFQQDGHIYDVSELCTRGTLDHHVHRMLSELNPNSSMITTPLSEVTLWDIILQTANGLVRLKQGHLLHLDIKPDNLLVTEEGVVKIGDFGTVVSRDEWSENCEEGDQRYLAPELLDMMTGRVNYSVDVYSLGMSLYEIITDIEIPKNGDQWHNIRSNTLERPTITFDNPVFQISDLVRRLVTAMIDRDPSKRPTAEQVFETAVSRILQLGVQPRTTTLPPPLPAAEPFSSIGFLPPSSPAPQPPPAPNRRRARSASRSKSSSRQTLLISPSANLLPAPPSTSLVPAVMLKPRPVGVGLAPRPVAPLVEGISTVTKSSVRALISQPRPRLGAFPESNPIAPDPSGFDADSAPEVCRSLPFDDSDDESEEKGPAAQGRSLGQPFRPVGPSDGSLAAPSILPLRTATVANPRGSESPGMHSALMNGVSKLQLI